jgi:hypothetical protein
MDKMTTIVLYNVATMVANVARLKKQTSLGQLLRRWTIWVRRVIRSMGVSLTGLKIEISEPGENERSLVS